MTTTSSSSLYALAAFFLGEAFFAFLGEAFFLAGDFFAPVFLAPTDFLVAAFFLAGLFLGEAFFFPAGEAGAAVGAATWSPVSSFTGDKAFLGEAFFAAGFLAPAFFAAGFFGLLVFLGPLAALDFLGPAAFFAAGFLGDFARAGLFAVDGSEQEVNQRLEQFPDIKF